MRKNDECNPLPVGVSRKIGTQKRFVSCVRSFIQYIKNQLFPERTDASFWTKSSQVNLILIMKVELIYFQIAYQNKRRVGSMGFIKSLIQQLGLSKVNNTSSASYNNEKEHNEYQIDDELDSDCDHKSELLSSSFEQYLISQEEKRQQLELEREMERLFMTEGEDGFSPFDKSILRKDLPIPEFYDKEDWTQEEIDQYSQPQNEIGEGKIVRYVPGLGWVVDE